MKAYLVTGGAGFIGSHIAETLIKQGHRVRILDNLSTGKQENIDYLKGLSGDLEWQKGDVSVAKDSAKAVEGMDAIFHQAALGSVPKSVEDPITSHHANITGTLQLLWEAKKAGVKRVVNAASSSAYGDTPVLPKVETMAPNTFSPYAVTKLGQEAYCRAFHVSYGMGTVSLRYFNVFGSRQDPHSQYAAVIPKFFQSFLRGESPLIYGDGEQTRDFTYVGDVVQANLKAAEIEKAEGQVYNIAGGQKISVNELATKIAELVGTDLKPKHVDERPGDIKHSLADISAAKKELGFHPETNLDQGLELASGWYKKYLA